MRGDELKERSGEVAFTPLPPIPSRLIQYRSPEDEREVLPPLNPNGIIGSDASGLDREFYEEIGNEGEQ